MTRDEIQALFERVLTWPPERLDDVGEILLQMEEASEAVGGDDAAAIWPLTEEERRDLEEAVREMERGDIASDEEVAALRHLARR